MKKKRAIYNYTVVVESCEEGGYFASCPCLPGCHVQGETVEEILEEMKHAIEAYLDDVWSHHESIPKPEQAIVATIPITF